MKWKIIIKITKANGWLFKIINMINKLLERMG